MTTTPETGSYRDPATTPTASGRASSADATVTERTPVTGPTDSDRGHADDGAVGHGRHERKTELNRQKEAFGGIKWGSAFFGWLTAIGTAVLLTALLAAVAGALGFVVTGGGAGAADQVGQVAQNPATASAAGITAAIVTAAVLLVAYYCGGYVAGRMARFNGVKQGIAVWVWTIVVALLVVILGAVASSQFDALGGVGGLPRLSLDPATFSVAGIVTAVAALVVSLVGAVLGGMAGMRFHRKIDRAGLS